MRSLFLWSFLILGYSSQLCAMQQVPMTVQQKMEKSVGHLREAAVWGTAAMVLFTTWYLSPTCIYKDGYPQNIPCIPKDREWVHVTATMGTAAAALWQVKSALELVWKE